MAASPVGACDCDSHLGWKDQSVPQLRFASSGLKDIYKSIDRRFFYLFGGL